MSFLQSLTAVSFHKYNPDWEIKLHVPSEEYKGNMKFHFIPDYTGKDYFHTLYDLDYVSINTIELGDYNIRPDLHGILRSDIFRYHVLYNEGGVWSDFDIIWLKPMEHFSKTNYYGNVPPQDISAVASFIHGDKNGHSIGVLIHAKHDPYIKSVIGLVDGVKPPFTHEDFGGNMLNAAYPSLQAIQERFPNTVSARFETYYPYMIHPPHKTIQKLYHGVDLSPLQNNNVLCLHWYNGHILSKDYVNNDGLNRNCSMTTLLKNEGYI
jgi:hypothetical protein